jgi:hypothetical protein
MSWPADKFAKWIAYFKIKAEDAKSRKPRRSRGRGRKPLSDQVGE